MLRAEGGGESSSAAIMGSSSGYGERRNMSNATVIYCDESGNTGANNLDPQQPFYVLGGWAVSERAIVEAFQLVEKTRQECCPQRDELKAAVFLNSEKGKRRAAHFIGALGAAGCVPLMVVAEKRYVVAGKIVETFLDPAFNNKLRPGFTWDTLTKRELADTFLCMLPSDELNHFAESYRTPSSAAFNSSLNEIACAAKTFVNPELAACIEGSLPNIERIAESEDPKTAAFGKISQTVNLPALMSFLLIVENLARDGAIDALKVVHDEHAVFESGMKEAFRVHREASDFVVDIPHCDVPYSSFSHIPEFQLVPSVDCQMVQAADVLAGVVNHLMKLALAGQSPTPADMELAKLTLPGFFLSEPRLTWLIISGALQANLVKVFILPIVGRNDGGLQSTGPMQRTPHITPMFPVVGKQPGSVKSPLATFTWDLPIYGILGRSSGALMMVNTGRFEIDGITHGWVLPLFTSQEKAAMLLRCWEPDELTETQDVTEFGPRELPKLIKLLEKASETVKVLVVDTGLNEVDIKFFNLEIAIEGMAGMWDRIKRIFSGGLDEIMIQSHDISGVQALTVLTSGGKYGALLHPSGKRYWGETRATALAALIEGEGLSAC